MLIKVPCWVEETDPVTGEKYDTEGETTKELNVGMGVSFLVKGYYAVWGEILEICDDESPRLQIQVDTSKGWLLLKDVLDAKSHNDYVMLVAKATADLNAAYSFSNQGENVKNLTFQDMINGATI